MEQEELTPDWLSLRHRITFALKRLRGGSNRVSDVRVAIYGPAALTALANRAGSSRDALPKKSFYAVHADAEAFLRAERFRRADRRPRHHRPAHLAEGPRQFGTRPRQPLCVGRRKVQLTTPATSERLIQLNSLRLPPVHDCTVTASEVHHART